MIWQDLLGSVRFAARGAGAQRLLTACMRQGIPLYGIRPAEGGFSATAAAGRYLRLSRLARRCGVRLRAGRRRGAWFWLRRYRGRWGLALAPAVFALAVQLAGGWCWAIRYDGLDAAACRRLGDALYSMDIYEGAVLTQEALAEAERALMDQGGYGWVSLNFSAGRLVVEATEAQLAPALPGTGPVDLVAAADGILLEMNARGGFARRSAGQTVAAGEVLVSGWEPDPEGRPVGSRAAGVALAAVRKVYRCEQPLTFEAQAPTGRLLTARRLRLPGLTLPLGGELGEGRAEGIVCQPLAWPGFALPATLEERYAAEIETRQFHLEPDTARQYARYACLKQLYSEFPDAEILAEGRAESWDGGVLTYTMTVDFKADIARERA